MSLRSVLIGFLLGLAIAAFTYFNDHIIRQTFFVGNHLPYSVFGLFILLVLVVNPLLRRYRPRATLRPLELAVVLALGLASCLWPGAGLFRCFTGFLVLPGTQYPTKATWRSVQAMSYVPGASSRLAEGFVSDWPALVRALVAGAGADSAGTPCGRLWQRLPLDVRALVEQAAASGAVAQRERGRLVEALNKCLEDRNLFVGLTIGRQPDNAGVQDALRCLSSDTCQERMVVRTNRFLLETALPGVIRPAPAGAGVLLADGDPNDPAAQAILQGWEGRAPRLGDLPWRAWRPSMLLWGTVALLFGIAALCMAVIVQPQWKREMLPYPLARFAQELTECGESGFLPKVAQSKLFWYGLGAMLVLHLVNGLYVWFPESIEITTKWTFDQLWQALPVIFLQRARQFLVAPELNFTVIAFTFFLNAQVSFSVGISVLVYALFGSLLAANGIALSTSGESPGNFTMMRFGSYVACAVMMIYVGRRYYLHVAAASLGLGRSSEVPASAAWALRVLLVCIGVVTALLACNSLDWQLGFLLSCMFLLMILVLTRINAETGIFFSKAEFVPVMPFLALMGVEALGPVALFMLLIVSMVLADDLRENAMTFLSNGLMVTTERQEPEPRRGVIPALAVMVAVSLVVAFCATLLLQYTHGLNYADNYAMGRPALMMDLLSARVAELSAYDNLNTAMAVSGWRRFMAVRPTASLVWWAVAGFAVFAGCSFARMRFPWWPLHPVLFLVWGTWFPCSALGFSIFVGWVCKTLTLRFGGAKGYHTLKPLMFGVISGELLAALGWSIVGTIYFFTTGLVPKVYRIFWS